MFLFCGSGQLLPHTHVAIFISRKHFPLETLVSPIGNIVLRSSSIIRVYHTHTLVQSIIQRHRRFAYLHAASSPSLNYKLCPRQLTRQPASEQNKNRNAREKNVGGVALRRGERTAPKKQNKNRNKQKQNGVCECRTCQTYPNDRTCTHININAQTNSDTARVCVSFGTHTCSCLRVDMYGLRLTRRLLQSNDR